MFHQNVSPGNSHYCVITTCQNLSGAKLMSMNIRYLFVNLNYFGQQKLLNGHLEYGNKHDVVNTTYPKPGENILKFKNIQNTVECPIKIVFDFESFLKPIDKTHGETKLYQKHIPCAFCIYII